MSSLGERGNTHVHVQSICAQNMGLDQVESRLNLVTV